MSHDGHRIAVLTDSTCDLPQGMREKHNIHTIPVHIHWGNETLRAGIDIDAQTFYNRLVRDPVHPTTSQPSVGEFLEVFRQIGEEADEIVGIFLSRELSGTISSAENARDMVTIPVHIVDSKSISLGVGAVVMAAVQARDAGGDAAAIVRAAERRAAHTNAVIIVDTLEYLHRGGRIGGAVKLVGHALSLKPVMRLVNGRLQPVSATRTRSKAIARMLQVASEGLDTGAPMGGGILHVAAPEEAAQVADQFQALYAPQELMTVEATPVIGIHVGPNALGVVAYNL